MAPKSAGMVSSGGAGERASASAAATRTSSAGSWRSGKRRRSVSPWMSSGANPTAVFRRTRGRPSWRPRARWGATMAATSRRAVSRSTGSRRKAGLMEGSVRRFSSIARSRSFRWAR